MRNDAAIKFKQVLNKYKIFDSFSKKVKSQGLKYNMYVVHAEAIYAFRRIFNLYDDSVYAKAAIEWEDTVVLNRYSTTINKHTDAHGMSTVIKVIHELQAEGKWTVPQGIEHLQCGKGPMNTAIKEKTSDEPTPPSQVQRDTASPAPSLLVTTPKPTLPDTKPLSNIPSFDSDDGNYDILDLTKTKKAYKSEVDDYHILINYEQGKTYRIRFNKHISNLMHEADAMNLQIRIDKLIGKTFFVFSSKKTPGSVPCRWQDKDQSIAILNSKPLCEYLIKGRTLSQGKLQRHISQNLSQRPDFLTFELFSD